MKTGPIRTAGWRLWLRQGLAVARFELRKMQSGRRWIGVLLLAGAPLVLLTVRVIQATDVDAARADLDFGFAVLFQSFYLRLAIFFACVDVFGRLFRGEVLEKTLHYYLLSPVRREIILAGKYLAGLAMVSVFFVSSTLGAYVLLYAPSGRSMLEAHFLDGAGIAHGLAYAGVAFLAVAGYGAVFLSVGFLARNPIVLAAIILGWESLNIFLPRVLQKISIIHYLQSICPVPLPFGPLAAITEPTSPWISVPGLMLTTAAVIALAGYRMRRAEVSYTTD